MSDPKIETGMPLQQPPQPTGLSLKRIWISGLENKLGLYWTSGKAEGYVEYIRADLVVETTDE